MVLNRLHEDGVCEATQVHSAMQLVTLRNIVLQIYFPNGNVVYVDHRVKWQHEQTPPNKLCDLHVFFSGDRPKMLSLNHFRCTGCFFYEASHPLC